MSSEPFPKIRILLFLRDADEQMKHLKLLSTIFLGVSPIGNLCDVWQLPNSRGKLDAMINYCYVIGSFRNKGRSVIGEFWDYLMFSKQRERNVVRVQAAVSLGGALPDIQKTAAKETRKHHDCSFFMVFMWYVVTWKASRCRVASRWLLKYFFLKSNDVLDAVLSTDLGEQRCFKFPIRQP